MSIKHRVRALLNWVLTFFLPVWGGITIVFSCVIGFLKKDEKTRRMFIKGDECFIATRTISKEMQKATLFTNWVSLATVWFWGGFWLWWRTYEDFRHYPHDFHAAFFKGKDWFWNY